MASTGSHSDKIKVAVRCRPLLANEDQSICVDMRDNVCTVHTFKNEVEATYAYDYCFSMNTTQEEIFNELGMHILYNAFEGYHATLFAYGQTGSGKSYSIHGNPDSPGLLPRLCDTLFEEIQKSPGNITHRVQASYLEIYNERLRDLLLPPDGVPILPNMGQSSARRNADGTTSARRGSFKETDMNSMSMASLPSVGSFNEEIGRSSSSTLPTPSTRKLEIQSHPQGGVYIPGLSVCDVTCQDDINRLMDFGNTLRVQACTSMNPVSSRSHAIFTLEFCQTDTKLGGSRRSKIHIVDLAGSERQIKAQASGDRLREGCLINQSLSYLGLVICGLTKGATYVPFRNSKLTHFLCEGLSGNSKTALIATVSPSKMNVDETISTLRFALTCKSVRTKAVINHDPYDPTIMQLRQKVDHLKNTIRENSVGLPPAIASKGPILRRPNFIYSLKKEPTLIGSSPESDIILPPCCARRMCELTVEQFEVCCLPFSTFLHNGEIAKKKSVRRLHDNDILDFGPGASYRFSYGIPQGNDLLREITGHIPDYCFGKDRDTTRSICRDTLESISHRTDMNTTELEAIMSRIRECGLGDSTQILLLQHVFQYEIPQWAILHKDKYWDPISFIEYCESDPSNAFVTAVQEGNVESAVSMHQSLQEENAELVKELHDYREKMQRLELSQVQDSAMVKKLSKQLEVLSREVTEERESFTLQQSNLRKTPEEYEKEVGLHRLQSSELEDRLKKREESISGYQKLVEELKENHERTAREMTEHVEKERATLEQERKKIKQEWALVEAERSVLEKRSIELIRRKADMEQTMKELEEEREHFTLERSHMEEKKEEENQNQQQNSSSSSVQREQSKENQMNLQEQLHNSSPSSRDNMWVKMVSQAKKDVYQLSSSSSHHSQQSDTEQKGFGPRNPPQSPVHANKNEIQLTDELRALSDGDPGFIEALAGHMIAQVEEGSARGLSTIIARIDSVAQSRNSTRVDALDALLPLMAKGLQKFGNSATVVRATFHCLARMCVRSSHNKWWLIQQATRGDLVGLFQEVIKNKKSSVLGQACKFLSVVILDGTQDGNLGQIATPYGNADFLDLVITIVQNHSYGSGDSVAHTFGYACHAVSAFLHAKDNTYLEGSAWKLFYNRRGVEHVLQGLHRYVHNRIAVFAVVQLLNAIIISGEDLLSCLEHPFPDILLLAMRLHTSHKGVQRICLSLFQYCLEHEKFERTAFTNSPNLRAALQNCQTLATERSSVVDSLTFVKEKLGYDS